MEKFKIVVCDHIHESGLKILENEKDIEFINASDIDKVELLNVISDAEVVVTRSSTDIDEKFVNAGKKLKGIIRAGVGVDNVDIDYCSKKGIIVMNVPTANTIAAVELTMTHMLSCVRTFPYSHSHLKDERIWKREKWYGTELKDKKLGIIGFGNIGSRVGIRAKAFDMEVLAYDPYVSSTKATDVGVAYTKNFDDILDCDIITIHTPKNKETIDMIGEAEIAKMRDGVILINCARGGLYNEEALYNGLKSKKIRFAGIDVFSKEPATDHKLLDLDNICVTPHLGANTRESQRRIATQAAENAISAGKGISYPNALNMPIKDSELPDGFEPYLELSQKLGFFCATANKGTKIKSIKILAEGEIASCLESISTFVTVGALNEVLKENINYVNAQYIAKERDINVSTEEIKTHSGYNNKVTVRLATEESVISVSGTVFANDLQRIVEINGFGLDIEPKGKMILFKNSDVPGVIGEVGTTLSKYNINIADFRLGRDSHNQALAVIIVDDNVTKEVIDELSSLKAALKVSFIEL